MNSREKIVTKVKANKPEHVPLPEINFPATSDDLTKKYIQIATSIGAKVYEVNTMEEVKTVLRNTFNPALRWISSLSEFSDVAETEVAEKDPHTLADVELSIISAAFGVAENSALWIPESLIPQRVLPFICQHLAILVRADEIVPTLHQAYSLIGNATYGYGVFIAGPSKTADIEQSLVLGAHGPKSLSIFILK
jgi:L-lactate dehydrogenase complex protein LldG